MSESHTVRHQGAASLTPPAAPSASDLAVLGGAFSLGASDPAAPLGDLVVLGGAFSVVAFTRGGAFSGGIFSMCAFSRGGAFNVGVLCRGGAYSVGV